MNMDNFPAKLANARAEIKDEYFKPHDHPWVIGYSGGKDSTLMTQLVFELLLSLAPSERKRPIFIVSNNTLVESPIVIEHLIKTLKWFEDAAQAFNLPIKTELTIPEDDQTFWVNLIGRGYPSPNRNFRWCTDRLKIKPTSSFIKKTAYATGSVILLLGVRTSESSSRAAIVKKHNNGKRLHNHPSLLGCSIFRPILDFNQDDVWEYLGTTSPPWGRSHKNLIAIYRDAHGGECPIVTHESDAPSCGTSSPRFGCWTCTVVQKDKSLEGFIDAGFSEFLPLAEFRDWLVAVRNDPTKRLARRRNGKPAHMSNGQLIPGPFTLKFRRSLLDQLLMLQGKIGNSIITENEINIIKDIWASDSVNSIKEMQSDFNLKGEGDEW